MENKVETTIVLIMGTQRLVPLSWSSAGAALTPNPTRVGDYVCFRRVGRYLGRYDREVHLHNMKAPCPVLSSLPDSIAIWAGV